MLIQSITIQSNYNNHNRYRFQNKNVGVNFKGKVGEAFLKGLETNNYNTAEVLKKLGIIAGGVVTATDGDTQDIFDTLAKKIQELTRIYGNIDRAEMKRWENSFRSLYDIKSEQEDYYGKGIQCAKISSIINGVKNVKVTNFNADTLIELATVMQDKDESITPAQMKFLERVVSAHNIDIKELIAAIGVLKKDSGIIDMDKSTLFLSLYLLPKSSIKSVIGTLSKQYGFEIPEGLKQTTETTSGTTNNQVTNNITPKQVNSKYTLEEALNHLKSVGVKCRIEDGGIIIDGDYKGDPTENNSTSTKLKNIQVDEQEIFKYVTAIKGYADFSCSQIASLDNLQSIGGIAYFNGSKITSLGKLETIGGTAYFHDSKITCLDKLETIGGDAYFNDSKITSLDKLETIGGDAYFNDSKITSLDKLETIGGNAYFGNSKITSLDKLETIGGNAYFGNSQITSLDKLQSIGGYARIANSLLSRWDFESVSVGGIIGFGGIIG